jgi:hypothetical protein
MAHQAMVAGVHDPVSVLALDAHRLLEEALSD